MNPLYNLYTQAALDSESLAPELEAAMGALVKADKTHGEGLLTALASRTDLSPATVALVEKSTSARVKVSWFSRPTMTADALMTALTREKRATVLAALAESPQASAELLIAISADPRPSVASAVLANEAAPDQAVLNAVMALDAGDRDLNYSQSYRAREVIPQHPGIHEDLAQRATRPEFLSLLLSSPLSVPAQNRLAKTLVEDLITGVLSGPDSSSQWRVQSMLRSAVEHAFELLENIHTDPDLGHTVANSISTLATPGLVNSYGAVLSVNLTPSQRALMARFMGSASERAAASAVVEALRGRVTEASTSTDPTRLGELLDEAIATTTPTQQSPLLEPLTTNSHLTLAQAEALVAAVDRIGARSILDTHASGGVDADHHPLLLSTALTHGFSYSMLAERCSDPSDFLTTALTRIGDIEDDWLQTRSYLNILNELTLTPDQLLMVPWRIMSGRPPSDVTPLLVDALGADPTTWEVFHSLAGDFSGTTGELLGSATALT